MPEASAYGCWIELRELRGSGEGVAPHLDFKLEEGEEGCALGRDSSSPFSNKILGDIATIAVRAFVIVMTGSGH